MVPQLEYVADLVVRIDAPLEIGRIAGNLRRMIPIAGGEVLGPRIRGKVLSGGTIIRSCVPTASPICMRAT